MGRKVLVIEDHAPTVELMRLVLRAGGYEVAFALDGPLGLQKAVAEQPDLILLDVMMPELDGFEVCRRLKADPRTSQIPIIMVSVKASPENFQLAEQAGACLYVTKPFDNQKLLDLLLQKLAQA